MHGHKVSGGYEVGFVFTEQQRDVALAAIRERTYYHRRFSKYWEKVVDDNMGKVRAIARRSTGYMGNKGFRLIVPTLDELRAAERTTTYALLPLFKAGDRVRTLVELFPWGNPEARPAGTMGTVARIESGDLYVKWDDEDNEWNCAPWWFEVVPPPEPECNGNPNRADGKHYMTDHHQGGRVCSWCGTRSWR